jgi:hypothetical protein
MNQQGLHFLNQAYIVLIPKKACPKVAYYMPISLIHSFVKLISKILVNRLGPELKNLVSNKQTTFIKQRCIHDSYMYIQGVIKELHKRKIPSMFIKLDIFKAFDTVN